MAEFKPITTQEEFDAAISERLKRERSTLAKQYEGFLSPQDAAKQYAGFLSPQDVNEKYKEYLSPEEKAKLDAKIKAYETAFVKTRIAHEEGIPFELVERLSGDDEDSIRRDAQTLAGFLAQKTTPGAPLGSTEPQGIGGKDAAYKNMAAALTKGE